MNMSNKSLFEKLFEEVMQDDANLTDMPPDEGGDQDINKTDDFDPSEEGDEVTLTLDRETAQKLYDLLGDILGDEQEPMDMENPSEGPENKELGMEGKPIEDMDQEDAEDGKYDEEEDSEEMFEAPQSKYEKFETNAKAQQFQKHSNSRVQGAVANKTSAHGKAEKTAQTQGTYHYIPFNKKVDQAKPGGSIKVNNPKYNPSGQGDSIFG